MLTLSLVIFACMESNAHPVQSHASIEVPHVASPLPNQPGLWASPGSPPLAFTHLLRECTFFLAEDNNNLKTFWCPEYYTNYVCTNGHENLLL